MTNRERAAEAVRKLWAGDIRDREVLAWRAAQATGLYQTEAADEDETIKVHQSPTDYVYEEVDAQIAHPQPYVSARY